MAIVIPRPVLALEDKLDKKGILLRNKGESRQDYERRQIELFHRSVEPAFDYLAEREIRQGFFAHEGFIIAYLKPQQYEELSSQSFIGSITTGDTEVNLVA